MKSGRLAQRLVCVPARVVKATPSTKLQKGLHRQNLRKENEEKRKGWGSGTVYSWVHRLKPGASRGSWVRSTGGKRALPGPRENQSELEMR